ncbi:MAG: Fe-S cluster-containing hydrogenase [Bacteroidota bacterium]
MIELDVLSAADRAADDAAQEVAGQAPTWRSRAAREGALDPSIVRDEFLPGAVGDGDEGTSRRTFLKVMGASAAFAGLTGCRRPVETILPYARKPEEVIPGVPTYYATAMPFGGVAHGLLVESHEGRPTKIHGNPSHPVTQGSTGAFAQASVLQLYDPDRSRYVYARAGDDVRQADYGAFVAEANRLLARRAGARVAVLAEPSASPALDALRQRFQTTFEGARWITLGAHLDDHPAMGVQQALGAPARPLYRFSEADVIVALDADFLGEEDPNSIWNSREYAASRRVDERGSMSRLYAIESTMTPTGGMADHRRAVKAGAVPFVAAAIAEALGVPTGASGWSDDSFAPFIAAIVEDVRAANGRAVFVAGATQPPEVHALAVALNRRFGTRTVRYLATGAEPAEPVGPRLRQLVADMAAGEVDVLLMLGTNPVYTLPAALGFEAALANVPTSIHVGLYRDETAQRATWHVPRAHYLESWGDARAYDGTLSVVQPLIRPLYSDAHSDLEILNTLVTGRNNAGYDLLRQALRSRLGAADFETAWRTALHDGFVPDTAFPTLEAASAPVSLAGLTPPDDGLELVFRTSPTLHDGAFSNVSWMQEAPHPVTKVTWDPVALVSPRTAVRLGVDDGIPIDDESADGQRFAGADISSGKHYAHVLRLTTADGAEADVPVWVQPGHPDESISVSLGYGRDLATDRTIEELGLIGRISRAIRPGGVSTDVYELGPISSLAGADLDGGPVAARVERLRALGNTRYRADVDVEVVGDGYLLASTQDHGSMEGRPIVRSATLAEYREDPAFAEKAETYIEDIPWNDFEPLWGDQNSGAEEVEDVLGDDLLYANNQWAMTIDLNACTGCNACVVACQAENNIPVVGKDQVARGREMHWIRMDRYYVGEDESDPGMVSMPMMCVHCENAPCEQVCPVNATVHSPDGLNAMVYNRCVGTRYCANNCPYKVRRYNYYNWTKTLPLEVQMQSNPYVTVRYRGVMEKCTLCVHRIRQAQQYAHIENRSLTDDDLQSVCQSACASDAIVFGDLNNPESAVLETRANPRNYAVLAYLAVKPRVTYLARLRNPHPALATPFDPEPSAAPEPDAVPEPAAA